MQDSLLTEINMNFSDEEKESFSQYTEDSNTSNKLTPDEVLNKLENMDNTLYSPITDPIYQTNKTNSTDYNEQFRDIYTDLMMLFSQCNKIDQLIGDNKQLNQSMLNLLTRKVNDIENRIKAFEFIVNNNQGFIDAMRESFIDRSNFLNYNQANAYMYKDPETYEIYNDSMVCDLNKISEALTLKEAGEIEPNNVIAQKSKQVGRGFITKANEKYPLKNAVDGSLNTLWNEVILADKQFKITYEDSEENKVFYDFAEAEYESQGALCKLKLIFNTPRPINTLTLNPIGEFPFKILNILSYESLNSDFVKILSADKDSNLDPFYLDQPRTLQFEPIKAKVIELGINQEHYKSTNYSLTNQDIENTEIVKTLFGNNEALLNSNERDDVKSALDLDNLNRNFLWSILNKITNKISNVIKTDNKKNIIDNLVEGLNQSISGFKKDKFNNILTKKINKSKDETDTVNVNKYEYQYGLKELLPSYIEYANKSMYISNLHELKGNTKEVALETSEEHPIPEDETRPVTSIEYYVTNLERPTNSDWYPILPENYEGHIESERLTPDQDLFNQDNDYFHCHLRFPADSSTVKVFKDNQLLDSDKYEVINNITEDNYYNYIKINEEFDATSNAVYTAEYNVTDAVNPHIIDFSTVASPIEYYDEDGTKGETFVNGTGKDQKVKLTYYPYVDYSKITDPINFVDTSVGEYSYSYPNNPLEEKYSPNYKKDGYGYQPLKVSLEGEVIYKSTDGDVSTLNTAYEADQDQSGVPYQYNWEEYDDNTGQHVETHTETNEEYTSPYFVNKTDYKKRMHPALNKYDEADYPVFEYLHMGKEIAFNDTFNEKGSDNQGEITVEYRYLVEGVRVKAVMRRNTNQYNGITPILYDYTLKSRNFQF